MRAKLPSNKQHHRYYTSLSIIKKKSGLLIKAARINHHQHKLLLHYLGI